MDHFSINRRSVLLGGFAACAGCVPNDASQFPLDASPQKQFAVGRIEITPPIAQSNQRSTTYDGVVLVDAFGTFDKSIKDRVLTVFSDTPQRSSNRVPRLREIRNSALLGAFFYMPIGAGRQYLQDVLYYTSFNPEDALRFRTNLYFDPEEDTAISYVGTIRIHRDSFFATERVEVLDQSARDLPLINSKFPNRSVQRNLLKV